MLATREWLLPNPGWKNDELEWSRCKSRICYDPVSGGRKDAGFIGVLELDANGLPRPETTEELNNELSSRFETHASASLLSVSNQVISAYH